MSISDTSNTPHQHPDSNGTNHERAPPKVDARRMSGSSQNLNHSNHRQNQHRNEETNKDSTTTTANKATIDAACARISAAVPEFPYLLSAPVNVEPRYHYPTRQEAESWARNTPFYLHEEGLQYMTYVYREPGDSCFVVRSHIDEERDRAAAAAQITAHQAHSSLPRKPTNCTSATTATTPSTPVSTGKKKKISLSAYRNKLSGVKAEQQSQSPEKEGPTAMESREDRKVNGVRNEPKHERRITTEEASGSKRPRDVEIEDRPSKTTSSNKKPRLSPPVTTRRPLTPPHKASLQPSPINDSKGAPHGLPALLSPTNPFESTSDTSSKHKKSSSNPWNLPDMLSPTLPPKIEAQLQKEKELGRPDSAASSPASKATRTPGSSAPNSTTKPQPSEGALLAKVKDGTSQHHMKQSEASSDEDEDKDTKVPEKAQQRELIVRLRYSKKLAWQIRQLLRLVPRPDRKKYPLDEDPARLDMIPVREFAERASAEKARARATGGAASPVQKPRKDVSGRDKERSQPEGARRERAKTPEKRPRVDAPESAPAAKKHKVATSSEQDKNPRTPLASAIPSPSVHKSGGSVKDSITVTPRQGHLKAAAMVRSVSQDTTVSTPGGKQSHLTPSASTAKSKAPTSVPATGPKAARLDALGAESQRYNALGRQLKHDNQDLATKRKDKDQQAEPERKRMALLGIECILAYMLAYSIGDARRKLEGRAAEIESSWRTLLPLFRHMRTFVVRYKPLDGLHNYLGIAINARISAVTTDRLSRAANAPLAADSPQSALLEAGGPGSLATENTKVLVDSFRAMTECARDAASKLPIEEINHAFPVTWASRATTPRETGAETLIGENGKVGEVHLRGRYWLPISVDTSPLQAVRFGAQIVREWIMVEELGYEPRIRADKIVLP